MSSRVSWLKGHQLVLHEGARALIPAMVQAMDQAHSSVHLETYIFDFEGSAQPLLQALERTAQRGVTVRVVVDGVGTPHCPSPWRERLEQARWRPRYGPVEAGNSSSVAERQENAPRS